MDEIKRDLIELIKKEINREEIIIVIGSRQVGKTTLINELQKILSNAGEKTVFFNLDYESDKRYFESQETLLSKIEMEVGKKKAYIFVDEIHRKENAGLFLKGIYDKKFPYKWIVTGSGSLELKEKIKESLSGRKRIYELNSITFKEFFHFKTEYKYKDKESYYFKLEKEKLEILLKEYLSFGGYPRVILEPTLQEKRKSIEEIYTSYIEKDIRDLGVTKTKEFGDMFRILSNQYGRILNYNELSNSLNLSLQTLKQYLWYAEKTFKISFCYPFFENSRKEITKSPLIYFNDIGFLNYSSGNFHGELSNSDYGFIFQNFIYNLLKEKIRYENSVLHFWRTTDGAEVDIVLKTPKEIIPIEVKFKKIRKAEVSRGFRNFLEKYKCKKGYIINLEYSEELMVHNAKVKILPWYNFDYPL